MTEIISLVNYGKMKKGQTFNATKQMAQTLVGLGRAKYPDKAMQAGTMAIAPVVPVVPEAPIVPPIPEAPVVPPISESPVVPEVKAVPPLPAEAPKRPQISRKPKAEDEK